MSVALITGGHSEIGAACAAALQARGVDVELADPGDASSVASVDEIDFLLTMIDPIPVDDQSERTVRTEPGPDEWRAMLERHVYSTAAVWRAALPGMLARGHGAICAITSDRGLTGEPSAPHYAAANGAIHTMAKALAAEVAPHGVRVNCLAVGATERDRIAAAACFILLEDTNLLGQVLSPTAGMV